MRGRRVPTSPAGGGRAAAAAKRDAELEQLNAWRTTMTMLKERLVQLEEEKVVWQAEKQAVLEEKAARADAESEVEVNLRNAEKSVAVFEASSNEKERLITVLLDRLTDKENQLRDSQSELEMARRRIAELEGQKASAEKLLEMQTSGQAGLLAGLVQASAAASPAGPLAAGRGGHEAPRCTCNSFAAGTRVQRVPSH